MQQGMLSSVLLSATLLIGVPVATATEMQPQRVEQWLQEPQVHDKIAELLQFVVEDDIDGLNFALQRLALPVQEVSRYLLLKKIEDQNLILTPKMALFVEQQKSMVPTYQVLERGDGYEFSVPAFNYPVIAHRLLKQWQQDQSTLAFVLEAERGELVLKDWLKGSEYQVQAREALLIRELDSLSLEAVKGLTDQLTQEAVTSWLPSSEVMVRLAQVSESAEVYKLLWLMKADFNSERELVRLARVGNEFSLNQVMQAASNPSLKERAITELTKVRPMSPEVQNFLVARMTTSDDAKFIAGELASQGYSSWLEELANSNQRVNSRAILSVLSQ
ncbi:hypothetical protein VIOR3934_17237 [Vibrio orientalis CIP 102891 = ATCC 33934]|uniref:HEAT repeat domain-containing protein n=1 Tax=Vibrio orientalis CIP 102891 = ATCC 33934 TaxID=675816 RepID=C9QBW4_VIBOR|nr:hypothetical protein [Vibrio orientalis]EEX95532.1 hypothetical protein VIA_000064 [Vibrio orientalis CIP 102891 = ATCC 33934]EGU48654.1 hypothetical protein VIOR3934_17237 [Vibrio orientalis CIP 102891 = ATCC 33934]